MSDYMPSGDRDFMAFAQNFLARAEEFSTEMGLTQADITRLQEEVARLQSAMENAERLRLASQAATAEKNSARNLLEDDFRAIVEKAQTRDEVTDSIRIAFDITVPSGTRSRTRPAPPLNAVAELMRDGAIDLQWDANGNPPNTQYIVEMQTGASGEWRRLDVVTKRRFTYYGAPLGERLTFRIIARRHGEESGPSNLATVGAQ